MKTQNEYLASLEEELRYLKQKEINEIVKHYREIINTEIDYGTSEEKVIKNLPNPKDIAKEIYDARGISYLEIQKRKYRKKEITQAIISSIIIFLMAVLFIGLTVLISIYSVNIFKFGIAGLNSFTSLLDSVLTFSFACIFILVILTLYILLIDVFYLIISHFLVNILKANKKTYKTYYKFEHFTISGFISEKSKVKKLLPIILIGLITCLLLISMGSYFSKGYIYRSLNDSPLLSSVKEYDKNMKNINIKGDDINIVIEVSSTLDNIKIEYSYEFEDNFNFVEEEKTLTISKEKKNSFSLFDLLDEPTPVLNIKLPSIEYLKNINFSLDNAYVYLKDIRSNALSLDIDIYKVDLYLENVELSNLILESYDANVRIGNTDDSIDYTKINSLDFKLTKGNIYMQGVNVIDIINIENTSAEIIISNCIVENLKLDTLAGQVVLNNLRGNTIEVSTSATLNTLTYLEFDTILVTGSRSTKIDLSQIMIKTNLEITSYSKAIIDIKYLKATNTNINNSSGNISITNVNKELTISEDDEQDLKEKKTQYNDFDLKSYSSTYNNINIESSSETYIHNSIINELNLVQNGSIFQIEETTLEKVVVDALNTKNLYFSEITCEDVYFALNNSPLTYTNYDVTTLNPIKIKYKGVSKVDANVEYNVVED